MTSIQISLNWAKSASWDEYEKELDRVVKRANPPSPAGLAAVGGVGAAAGALPTPPTPSPTTPPPAAGFDGMMNNAMSTISNGWKSMPTWGQGALIGAGIGGIGGMLSDKKKTRGLLSGALLGGGMGALGGYAYDQMGMGSDKAVPGAGTNKTTTPNLPTEDSSVTGNVRKVTDTVANKAMDAGKVMTGDSVGAAAGMGSLGYLLNRRGQQNVQTVGAAPATPMFPGKKTISVLPSSSQMEGALKANQNGELESTLGRMASKQPLPKMPPMTPEELLRIPTSQLSNPNYAGAVAQNAERYMRENNLGGTPYTELQKRDMLRPNTVKSLNDPNSVITPVKDENFLSKDLRSPTSKSTLHDAFMNAKNQVSSNLPPGNVFSPGISANDILDPKMIKLLSDPATQTVNVKGVNIPVSELMQAGKLSTSVQDMVRNFNAQAPQTPHNANNAPTANTVAETLRNLQQPGVGRSTRIPVSLGNGETMPVTMNDLIKQRAADLKGTHPEAKAHWRGYVPGVQRAVGQAGMWTGGLGLANQARNAWSSGGPDVANRIGSQPPTESGLANVVQFGKGLDVNKVMQQIQNWPDELKQRAFALLTGK